MRTNTSDRKIVSTGERALATDEYRGPEVAVVGADMEVEEDGGDSTDTVDDGDEQPDEQEVGVVRGIIVESQEVRIQPDGSAVIDVVVSFEEATDAVKHELRISKL